MSPLPPDVLLLKTSPRRESRSALCAERAADRLRSRGVRVVSFWQRELPLVPADTRADAYPGEIRRLLDVASTVRGVILACPVQKNAISGATRNAVELIRDGLVGKPVLPVVAAGSQRGHLAAEALRADLFVNFEAAPLRAVVTSPDIDELDVARRIDDAVDAFIPTLGVIPALPSLEEVA